jgi:hypothetical protein
LEGQKTTTSKGSAAMNSHVFNQVFRYKQFSRSNVPKKETPVKNILLEQGDKMLEVDFLKHLNEKRTVIGVKASVHLKDDKTGRTVAWVIRKGISEKIIKNLEESTPKLFQHTKGISTKSKRTGNSASAGFRYLGIWKRYTKIPTITCATLSRADIKVKEWLSELEKESYRLSEADTGEEGLDWLATNRMLFYALQAILEKYHIDSFNTFTEIQQKFRSMFPDLPILDMACFHICAVIDGVASKPHRDRNNLSQSFGFTVPFGSKFKGGNIVLHEYNTEITLRCGDVLFFDAANTVHSVTPVTKGTRKAVVVWGCNSLSKTLGISNNQPDNGTALRNKLIEKLNM